MSDYSYRTPAETDPYPTEEDARIKKKYMFNEGLAACAIIAGLMGLTVAMGAGLLIYGIAKCLIYGCG